MTEARAYEEVIDLSPPAILLKPLLLSILPKPRK